MKNVPSLIHTLPPVNTPAPCQSTCPLSICLPCCRYTCLLSICPLPVDTPTLLSICLPPVDMPASCWYAHLLLIRPLCCWHTHHLLIHLLCCWYAHPAIDTLASCPICPPWALLIHLCSLSLLWAVVLQIMWQGAWVPTSLKEGRGKECRGGDGGQHAWLDVKCIFASYMELAGGGRNNGIGNCIITQVTRVTLSHNKSN